MIAFQAFLLLGASIGCVLPLPVPANATANVTDGENPLTIPIAVLNQLTDITKDSKGLLPLWKSANYLANDRILISEVSIKTFVLYACAACACYHDVTLSCSISNLNGRPAGDLFSTKFLLKHWAVKTSLA